MKKARAAPIGGPSLFTKDATPASVKTPRPLTPSFEENLGMSAAPVTSRKPVAKKSCHPERSEGPAFPPVRPLLSHFARVGLAAAALSLPSHPR